MIRSSERNAVLRVWIHLYIHTYVHICICMCKRNDKAMFLFPGNVGVPLIHCALITLRWYYKWNFLLLLIMFFTSSWISFLSEACNYCSAKVKNYILLSYTFFPTPCRLLVTAGPDFYSYSIYIIRWGASYKCLRTNT